MLLVALVWLAVRDRPADKGWPGIDEIDGDGTTGQASSGQGGITLMQGARQVVSTPHFWPLAIWLFLDCGIFFGFGALWGGPYMMHVYGMRRDAAGALLSMIAWGMIVGSPLLGFLSDRVLKSRKKPFLICTGLLVALLLFLVLNPDGLSRGALAGFFFLFSICASAIVVIGFTATKELFPVQIAGTSVGTVNLFPFLGGAVFMPLLGRVLDAFPRTDAGTYSLEAYRMLLVVLLASAVLALVCTFFIKETFDQ
mgnify:FL=1